MTVTRTMVILRSGTYVDLADPDCSDVTLRDVAWSLAHINRFSGAAGTYSVAQHSVLVCRALRDWGHGALVQRCGLMHDAHEALIGDIGSPLKRLIGLNAEFDFSNLANEVPVWEAIAGRFRLPKRLPGAVKKADLCVLATEARDLFGVDAKAWGIEECPLDATITRWDVGRARECFLDECVRVGVL
jgi:hypothetical protein